MRVPPVSERIKEAPAQALRGVFAGIGQLLLITDKLRNKTPQDVPRARKPEASEKATATSPAGQRGQTAAAPAEPAAAEPTASAPATGEAVAADEAAAADASVAADAAAAAEPPAGTDGCQGGHGQACARQAHDRQARRQASDRQAGDGQARRQAHAGGACRRGAAEAAEAAEPQGLRQDR